MALNGTLIEDLRSETAKRGDRTGWGFSFVVAAIPSLLWLGLVCVCKAPVLFGDEWTFVPFIVKLRAGALSLQDFWIAYGEHRLTLSRLCFSLFFGRGFVDPLLLVSAFVRKHTRQAAPFFVLGFYGCAYAVLVTLGRAENGYNDWFLTSRYTTSALALTLAVIGLGLRERQNRTGGRSGAAYQVLLTVVLVLALANSAAGFRLAKGEATLRLASMRLLDMRMFSTRQSTEWRRDRSTHFARLMGVECWTGALRRRGRRGSFRACVRSCRRKPCKVRCTMNRATGRCGIWRTSIVWSGYREL
jgi:hypothetical protein